MLRFPFSFCVPALLVAVTLLVLTLTLSASLGGYGAGQVFAYHPAFMSVAFLLLMPLGVLSYGIDLGERGNAAYPDRESRRVLHGTLNLLGACLAGCGYLVAFVYHAAKGKDLAGHLALNFNGGPAIPSRTVHVFLGLAAVFGSLVMAVSGLYKFVVAARDGQKRLFKWHGLLGPLVWLCGCVRARARCVRAGAILLAETATGRSLHRPARSFRSTPSAAPSSLCTSPLARSCLPSPACFASASPRTSSTSRRTRPRRASSRARTGRWARSRPL